MEKCYQPRPQNRAGSRSCISRVLRRCWCWTARQLAPPRDGAGRRRRDRTGPRGNVTRSHGDLREAPTWCRQTAEGRDDVFVVGDPRSGIYGWRRAELQNVLSFQRDFPQRPADRPAVCGYTREAGVWDLAGALGELCAKLVRRRAESDEVPVDVTPQTLVEMLGAHGRRRLRERGSTSRWNWRCHPRRLRATWSSGHRASAVARRARVPATRGPRSPTRGCG